jgi:hypothetical protein
VTTSPPPDPRFAVVLRLRSGDVEHHVLERMPGSAFSVRTRDGAVRTFAFRRWTHDRVAVYVEAP